MARRLGQRSCLNKHGGLCALLSTSLFIGVISAVKGETATMYSGFIIFTITLVACAVLYRRERRRERAELDRLMSVRVVRCNVEPSAPVGIIVDVPLFNSYHSLDEEDECSICLDPKTSAESVSFEGCNHSFHEKCIRDWLSIKSTCPLCRAAVV